MLPIPGQTLSPVIYNLECTQWTRFVEHKYKLIKDLSPRFPGRNSKYM